MNVLPIELEGVFEEIEGWSEPWAEEGVSTAIDSFAKRHEQAGSELTAELRAEAMAFAFYESSGCEKTIWGTYYGPMLVMEGQEWPGIKLVTPQVLEYWQARAQEAKHPILRARYAGLVWDFSPKIRGRTADIICAQMCIDASIQLASPCVYKRPTGRRNKLERALSVALSIRDQERVRRVAGAIIELEEAEAELDKLGTWGFSFDLLVENNKIELTEDQVGEIIDRLERFLVQGAPVAETPGDTVDHFAAENAAVRLARYYRRQNRRDDIRRVLTAYADAVRARAKQAMPLLGVAWLHKAHDILLQFGIRDEAEAVAVLMRELGKGVRENLVRSTQKIEFTQEEIDAWLEEVMQGDENDVVARIVGGFIPDAKKLEREIKDSVSRSVLTSLFTIVKVDSEGRNVARIGPVEDDMEGRVVDMMSRNMQFEGVFLNLALRKWIDQFEVDADGFADRVMMSPLFSGERRHILFRALAAYLQGDHVSAVHLLVPQIEHAFRTLLELTGQSTYRAGRHGGFNLKNLDDLLRDEVTEHVFGAACVTYLRVLLTNQRGWNIRNKICHGLVDVAEGQSTWSDRVIHVLLVLSMIRTGDASSDANQPEA